MVMEIRSGRLVFFFLVLGLEVFFSLEFKRGIRGRCIYNYFLLR